jgi:hypothetical protein
MVWFARRIVTRSLCLGKVQISFGTATSWIEGEVTGVDSSGPAAAHWKEGFLDRDQNVVGPCCMRSNPDEGSKS